MSKGYDRLYVTEIVSVFAEELKKENIISQWNFVGDIRLELDSIKVVSILMCPINIELLLNVFEVMWGDSIWENYSREGKLEDIDIKIILTPQKCYGAQLLLNSGSKEFIRGLQDYARLKSMYIDYNGLRYNDFNVPIERSEKEIFKELGLEFIEPKNRLKWDFYTLKPLFVQDECEWGRLQSIK